MDFFHRKEYSFETPEIKKWLTGWLKTEKWSIKEMVQFLQENYELKTPIHFANYNVLHSMIDCIPATGEPITLQYYRTLPRNQVRIIVDNATYCYKFDVSPKVQKAGKIVKLPDGGSMHAKYRYHDYTYKMYEDGFASQYRVRLFITDSEKFRSCEDHKIITYTDSIEAYMSNCEEIDAVAIYHKVCGLIGFDYREIDNIHVTCNPKENPDEMTVTEIEVEYGKIVSCEAHKGRKRYKVALNEEFWSWEYADPEQSICFEFTQERIDNTEEAKKEIETDIREDEEYRINPEIMDNVLSEVTQVISDLLEMME